MSWRLWLVYAVFQFVGKCCSGLDITNCQHNKATVSVGTTVTLTCGKYSEDIEWTYGDDSETVIGQCDGVTCTTDLNLPFSLQAHETGSSQYESVLSITNTSSEQTFHLKCRNKESDEKAKCLLQVVNPPQYDPTRCKVWLSNWRVLGQCTVDRLPASGVDYDCNWSENNEGKFGDFKDKPSYYTLHDVSYARRNCSFNRSMNFEEKAYTYSINVPGMKHHFADNITVEHPGEPTHNCPTMVAEGTSVSCRCNTSKAGNPPAITVWDGVRNETLHIENIQRQTKTNIYTCRVVWGIDGWINRSTFHTFDVAYGPSSVRIDIITDETGYERHLLRLKCTAVDVYPAASFRWNITCDTLTHNSNTSTCAFSAANVSQGTVVTCTASNNISDMTSFSSFVVHGAGGIPPRPKNNLPVPLIVFFPVLVVIVVLAVIAVKYRSCRKVNNPKPREPSAFSSPPEAEESAPESPTASPRYVSTMIKKEETEEGAKCNNDTIQSNTSTDYYELCDFSEPERCAAPSGVLYTRASKGGARSGPQDKIDMSKLSYNKLKLVKESEPKRDTGISGDLYRGKDKKEGDAKFTLEAHQLNRSAGSEPDIQSPFESCSTSSRPYVNDPEIYNRLDIRKVDQHRLRLEAANEDMNVPTMETTVKSGKPMSSTYLHPLAQDDDDTYNHLVT